MLYKAHEIQLLNAAISTGAGAEFNAERERGWTFFLRCAGASSGGTLKIQGKVGGTWFDIHEEVFTGTADKIIYQNNGQYMAVRANLSARTDGAYSVWAIGGSSGL
jgi:hypothetical protein